jgi:hypothetical protein
VNIVAHVVVRFQIRMATQRILFSFGVTDLAKLYKAVASLPSSQGTELN